jgi:hypothetical protein
MILQYVFRIDKPVYLFPLLCPLTFKRFKKYQRPFMAMGNGAIDHEALATLFERWGEVFVKGLLPWSSDSP